MAANERNAQDNEHNAPANRFKRMVQEKFERLRRQEEAEAEAGQHDVPHPAHISIPDDDDWLFVSQDDVRPVSKQPHTQSQAGENQTASNGATPFAPSHDHSNAPRSSVTDSPYYIPNPYASPSLEAGLSSRINESSAPNDPNSTPASLPDSGNHASRHQSFPLRPAFSSVSTFNKPSSDPNPANGQRSELAKRQKKTTDAVPEEDPVCICEISTACPLAAKNGVHDCRTSFAPVYERTRKPKPQQDIFERKKVISAKERARISRSNSEVLYALTLYDNSRRATGTERDKIFDNMRARIHKLQFHEIGPESKKVVDKFLDPQTGIAAITNDTSVPYDIILDLEMIRFRWDRGDFDSHLMRGIIEGRTESKQAGGSHVGGTSRKLDPQFEFKMPSNFVGEGHLRNGQWFPFQINAIRDGAHGEIEAGISGNEDGVAVSIILNSAASKRSYADIDEGTSVSYCGTRGKDGKPSANTLLLIEAEKRNTPIRLLRGSKLAAINKYRPAQGLRYDGLYKIIGKELLEEDTKLYRFRLIRIHGQTAIRHSGKECRPTFEEIEETKASQNEQAVARLANEKKRKRA